MAVQQQGQWRVVVIDLLARKVKYVGEEQITNETKTYSIPTSQQHLGFFFGL